MNVRVVGDLGGPSSMLIEAESAPSERDAPD
jgi:hypothetical protein